MSDSEIESENEIVELDQEKLPLVLISCFKFNIESIDKESNRVICLGCQCEIKNNRSRDTSTNLLKHLRIRDARNSHRDILEIYNNKKLEVAVN